MTPPRIPTTAIVLVFLLVASVASAANEPPYLAAGDIKPGPNLSYSTDWQAVCLELAQTLASTGRYRLVSPEKLQELLMTLPMGGDGISSEGDGSVTPTEPPVSPVQRVEGTAARLTAEDEEQVAKLEEAPGFVLDEAIGHGTGLLAQTGLGKVGGLAGRLGEVARGTAREKPKTKAALKLTLWLSDARTGVQLVRTVGYGVASHENMQQAWKLAVEEAVRNCLGELVDVSGTVVRMDPGGKPKGGKAQGARIVVDLTAADGLAPEQDEDGSATGAVLEIRQPDQDDPDLGLVEGELIGFALCCEAGDRGARCVPFGLGNKVGPPKGKQLKEWWDAVEPGFVAKLRLDVPRCELPKPEEPIIAGATAKGPAPQAAPAANG